MIDSLLNSPGFPYRARNEFFHLLSAAENGNHLLILARIYLDLIYQLFIDQFILVYEGK